jgi:hypothetical protein
MHSLRVHRRARVSWRVHLGIAHPADLFALRRRQTNAARRTAIDALWIDGARTRCAGPRRAGVNNPERIARRLSQQQREAIKGIEAGDAPRFRDPTYRSLEKRGLMRAQLFYHSTPPALTTLGKAVARQL